MIKLRFVIGISYEIIYCNLCKMLNEYSALVVLYEHSISASDQNQNQRRRAELAMDQIFGNTIRNMDQKMPYLVTDRNRIPPWGLHIAYRASINCIQKRREGAMNEENAEALKWLHQTLTVMDGRWKVAGTYLKLIEAREVMGI